MSSFVLNRNYQLQLPSSFVDVDCEEMQYVDGGTTYSGAKGWGAAAAMAAIGEGAATFGAGMTAMLAPFGPVGWLTAAISFAPLSYVGAQLGSAGTQAAWYMVRKGRFTITTNDNPFNLFNVS